MFGQNDSLLFSGYLYITYITFKNVSIFLPRFLSIDSLSFAMHMDAETWMQLSRSWLGKSIHLLWVFHGLMSFCWAHHGDMIEICFTNLTWDLGVSEHRDFLPSVSGPSIGRLMINQLIDHYILEGCLNSRWKWDRAKSGWIPLLKNLCGWYRPFRSLGGELDYETETDGLSIWLAPCHFGFLWDVDMFLRSSASRMESRLPAGNLPSNLRMGRPLLLQESSSCDKTWAPCKSAEWQECWTCPSKTKTTGQFTLVKNG